MFFNHTRMRRITMAGLCLGLGLFVSHAHAVSINVPSHSFETPVTPFVNVFFTDWQETGPVSPPIPEFGIPESIQTTGVFLNTPPADPTHISNADGNQLAFITAIDPTENQNVNPGADPITLYQVLPDTYQQGQSYEIALAAARSADFSGGGPSTVFPLDPINHPGTLRVSLFYGPAPTGSNTVASVDILANQVNVPTLTDFFATAVTVQPGDAWFGQSIGILIEPTAGVGGIWNIDNVRLNEDVAGDANRDGVVGPADLTDLKINWLLATGALWEQGDFTGDDTVGPADLTQLKLNWLSGALPSAPATVPEPASVALLLLAGAAITRRRSR